ncbi:toxin-antitoxin system [Rhodococcus erythropolis]|uniref:toxin-antitoxin system n=1 Tax=Rhodococcus erythropolis TaxID=1833 RepID=UPI0030139394
MSSKGLRTRVTSRIPNEVYAILEDRRRHAAAATSLSQFVSDVLALYVGRPDLAVELTESGQTKGQTK